MSNNKATRRLYGGNYTKFTWSLIFFLHVKIVLDVVFLLQDFGFLRGVLVWNAVVTVTSILVTPFLTAYLSAIKRSCSVPSRPASSKILPQRWTLAPNARIAYTVLSFVAILWLTAAIPLCYLLAHSPEAVSQDDESTSTNSDSGSTIGSNSDPGCVGIQCRRSNPGEVVDAGSKATDKPAIGSAILPWVFFVIYIGLAVELWKALKYFDRQRQGNLEASGVDEESSNAPMEHHLLGHMQTV